MQQICNLNRSRDKLLHVLVYKTSRTYSDDGLHVEMLLIMECHFKRGKFFLIINNAVNLCASGC